MRPALDRSEETEAPAVAIELPNGQIVIGKTTSSLRISPAVLLNALKALGSISDEIPLILPSIVESIQKLRVNSLGNYNPRLHTDEILVALSISATTNPASHLVSQQLGKLEDCEVHNAVILSQVDANVSCKLSINLICGDRYQTEKLYHR